MTTFSLVKIETAKYLQIEGAFPTGFHGEQRGDIWLCPLDAQNAQALRQALPWTAPTTVGLRKSIGCGDRLGLATPGHIQAARGSGMFPTLAQQSIREMTRSNRSAQQVLDDVTWGVLASNYKEGWGCDADHLKNTDAIDTCISAGYIGFTLDPGEYVDNDAHTDNLSALQTKYAALPWDALAINPDHLLNHYQGTSPVGELNAETIYRAACKYSRALSHVANLARHIAARLSTYDLEISVDETETPTSPAEHFFIASELGRMGIRFQGLAPRFIGRFEKGVDYIGDLAAFETDYAAHAHIANKLGPYKLSIHSGSDKFSLYPIIAKHSGEYVHLKTAGTSWLEALRVIAQHDTSLFRDILTYAKERYATDKASYHVSADLAKMETNLGNADLPDLLNQFDARQVLHVTFGSLLEHFRDGIYTTLNAYEADYHAVIKAHFDRHIAPFIAS